MLDERNIDLIALGREVFVNGSWSQEGATGSLLVDNPATGEVTGQVPFADGAAPGWPKRRWPRPGPLRRDGP